MRRDIFYCAAFLLFIGLQFTCGCYGARNEVRQLDETAHLVFTGAIQGAKVTLNRGSQLVWSEKSVASTTRYSMPGGNYTVIVKKGGDTVVQRRVFLTNGMDFEIHLP